jgi:hypothetical protein
MPTTPTQTKYPWRAAVRTVIQAAIGIATMLPFIVSATGLSEQLPFIAGALAVSAVITRIMANPLVNAWLTKLGLGATSKNVIIDTAGNRLD